MIVFGRRLHKLEKLVSDPYLLYLANKNMFKLKLQAITDPAIVLSMFMLSFCFVIVCGLKRVFISFFISVWSFESQSSEGGCWDQLPVLTSLLC